MLVAFPQCLWGRTQPGSFRSPQQEMYSSLKTKCKSLSYISPICVNITRSPWFPSAFVSTKNVSVTLFFWRKFRESRDYTGIGRIIPFCQRKVHICCQQQRSGQHSGLVLAPWSVWFIPREEKKKPGGQTDRGGSSIRVRMTSLSGCPPLLWRVFSSSLFVSQFPSLTVRVCGTTIRGRWSVIDSGGKLKHQPGAADWQGGILGKMGWRRWFRDSAQESAGVREWRVQRVTDSMIDKKDLNKWASLVDSLWVLMIDWLFHRWQHTRTRSCTGLASKCAWAWTLLTSCSWVIQYTQHHLCCPTAVSQLR